MLSFKAQFIRALSRCGLSRKELSIDSGVSRSMISSIAGGLLPSAPLFRKLLVTMTSPKLTKTSDGVKLLDELVFAYVKERVDSLGLATLVTINSISWKDFVEGVGDDR